MEVRFTPEQEAQLSQIAMHSGMDAEQLVKQAALRILQENAQFREDVARGIAAAERGDFIESAEVWSNVEKLLHS